MAFDFLDDLTDLGSDLYGKAVELGKETISSIKLDTEAEKVTDKTPVESNNRLPVASNFLAENKTLIMMGGGVVGIMALLVLTQK